MPAVGIHLVDSMGHRVGGLILLDQGHRRLTCDWLSGCDSQAVAAIECSVTEDDAAPQLACSMHLGTMHASIWAHRNPPRLQTYQADRLLARNSKVA